MEFFGWALVGLVVGLAIRSGLGRWPVVWQETGMDRLIDRAVIVIVALVIVWALALLVFG